MIAQAIRLVVDNTAGSHVDEVMERHGIAMAALDVMRITAQPEEPADAFERELWHALRADLSARCREAAARAAHAEMERQEAIRRKACERLRTENVPEASFGSWQRPDSDKIDVGRRIADWIDGGWRNHPVMVLSGPYGRGKTHLAVAALRRVAEAGGSFAMATLEQMLSETDPSQNRDGCRDAMLRWQYADVAVIDECPATRGTLSARQSARLYEVLDGRLRGPRPTVLTTNRTTLVAREGDDPETGLLNAVEIETRGKLQSRLSGHGLFLRFRADWPDFRQRRKGRATNP